MTSIGTVKNRLVTILGPALPATQTLPASQVLPGPVDVTTLGPRVFEVGSSPTPIQFDPSSLDGRSGTQTYTLTLTASVSLPGTDLSATGGAEDQAEADFVAAVAAIRTDPSLGIANLSATCSGAGELVEQSDSNGRVAAVRFPVEIFTTF